MSTRAISRFVHHILHPLKDWNSLLGRTNHDSLLRSSVMVSLISTSTEAVDDAKESRLSIKTVDDDDLILEMALRLPKGFELPKDLGTVLEKMKQSEDSSASASSAAMTVSSDSNRIVDRVRVRAMGGRGGNGAASFRKDGGSRGRRGADGGNGAHGGDCVIKANAKTKSLASVGVLLKGGDGGKGGKERMQGKRGHVALATVPVGTVVWEEEMREDDFDLIDGEKFSTANWGTAKPVVSYSPSSSSSDEDDDDFNFDDFNENDDDDESLDYIRTAHLRPRGYKYGIWRVLADLSEDEDSFTLATGGKGGKGNANFPTGKTAGDYERGELGTERRVVLELKTVADVGFIGFPNAGKSTLLAALTNATPKIAPYAFTTLTPQFGAREVDLDKENETKVSLTFADVPGLLPGAHRNRGLGHDFLRHVERCRVHAYIVDATGGSNSFVSNEASNSNETNKPPHEALLDLVNELETYKPDITKNTPAIVVVNKMDIAKENFDEKKLKKIFSAIKKATRTIDKTWEIVSCSGKTGESVDEVLQAASRAWKKKMISIVKKAKNDDEGDFDDYDDDKKNSSSDSSSDDFSEDVWSNPDRFS